MCTDHPLLTYIEDGIRCGDIAGWQLMKSMLATKHEYVQIGVNKWFKSDIDTIKQFTQLIQKEDEDEDEDQEAVDQANQVDLNADKFIPDMVHLSR